MTSDEAIAAVPNILNTPPAARAAAVALLQATIPRGPEKLTGGYGAIDIWWARGRFKCCPDGRMVNVATREVVLVDAAAAEVLSWPAE